MNLNGLRTAASFLTRVPINTPNPVMAAAAPWFPIVGVAIGVAQGAVLVGARQVLPPLPAAVLAVAAAALITGAFHHDGLADMADAFGGGWDVEQRLAIMKDSRLGTYGTSALILAFATEISVLASIDSDQGFRAVIAAHALSRAIAVAVMFRAPAAKTSDGGGMGASYAAELSPLGAAAAVLVGLAVCALVFTDLWTVIAAVGLAIFAALAVVVLAIRKIDGVTGDVLGAVQQLASLAILLVAASSI